jgi:hypothetical protein
MKPKSYNEGFNVSSSDDYDVRVDLRYRYYTNASPAPYLDLTELNTSADMHNILNKLTAGDLIVVKGSYDTGYRSGLATHYFYVKAKDDNLVDVVTAIDGQPEYEMQNVSIEVIRSGYTNQLNAMAATIVTYGSDCGLSEDSDDDTPGNMTQREVYGTSSEESSSSEFSSLSSLVRQLNQAIETASESDAENSYTVSASSSLAQSLAGSSTLESAGLSCRLQRTSQTADSDNQFSMEINSNGEQTTYQLSSGGRWSLSEDGVLNYTVNGNTELFIDAFTQWGIGQLSTYELFDGCVISASAITYDDDWSLSTDLEDIYDLTENSLYIKAQKGKWRPKKSYVYNTDIIGGSQDQDAERIYKAAGVADEFYLFDFNSSSQHSNWANINTVTSYSPHGEPIEERDVLAVYSHAKFGYQNAVPFLTAANATYESCMFESFENNYGTAGVPVFEDGFGTINDKAVVSTAQAHSGSQSVLLTINGASSSPFPTFMSSTSSFRAALPLKDMQFSHQLKNEGMLVQFWTKNRPDNTRLTFELSESAGQYSDVSFTETARVEDWTLYQAELSDWGSMAVNTDFNPVIKVSDIDAEDVKIWIDDVRLQPSTAEMNCYVYDPTTLRLSTSFDSQHFGAYYQYNAEGKLIRTIAETEKGKRTVKESHYNTATVQRPDSETEADTSSSGSFDLENHLDEILSGNRFGFSLENLGLTSELDDISTSLQSLLDMDDENADSQLEGLSSILSEYLTAVTIISNEENPDLENTDLDSDSFRESFYNRYLSQRGSAVDYDTFSSALDSYRSANSTSLLNQFSR